MNILVLHDALASADASRDALSPDAADTLVQAREAAEALDACGHRVRRVAYGAGPGGAGRVLAEDWPDVVFNLLESVDGKGHRAHEAAHWLEGLGLPYSGSNARGLLLAGDKRLAKRLLEAAGLPTPRAWMGPGEGTPLPKGRYIIKAATEHASIGMDPDCVVDCEGGDKGASELAALVEARARAAGLPFMAERYVEGRELHVPLLFRPGEGLAPLPVSETLFGEAFQGRPRVTHYAAKWDEASPDYGQTPRSFRFTWRDEGLLGRVRALALAAAEVLGLEGYVRVDFRVDAGGGAWIIDVNANPCLSRGAGFMASAEREGLSIVDVCRRLLVQALARHGAGSPRAA